MLFSSITFLYYFLPITIVLSFVVPKKCKNLILFLASFFFYFWGEPKYSILLLISVILGYIGGILIEKNGQSNKQSQNKDEGFTEHSGTASAIRKKIIKEKTIAAKIITGIFIAVSLGLLVFFKYTDLFISTWNQFGGANLPLLKMALPIGISFYSFQIISYYIDVYRGEIEAEHNFIDFAAYVTMFPQLIAGPIVRFQTVQPQLKDRKLDAGDFSKGALRFVCGLCKKVLIADSLGELVTFLEKATDIGTAGFWVLALAYMLQIYYDFSGYSDMAIGLGRILGFTFPENFQYPYISKSITEFWRRWHMTLGGWFRDYLYIPLGGNRVNTLRWCFNMFLVWFFSGLWHGASWNFALWGVYFGFFLAAEKLIAKYAKSRKKITNEAKVENNIQRNYTQNSNTQKNNIQKSHTQGNNTRKSNTQDNKKLNPDYNYMVSTMRNVASHSYTLLIVFFSFVIFRVESLSDIGRQFVGLFGGSQTVMAVQTAYEIRSYMILLLIAMVGSTPLIHEIGRHLAATSGYKKSGFILDIFLIAAGLILATAFLMGSSVHPFLYFRF